MKQLLMVKFNVCILYLFYVLYIVTHMLFYKCKNLTIQQYYNSSGLPFYIIIPLVCHSNQWLSFYSVFFNCKTQNKNSQTRTFFSLQSWCLHIKLKISITHRAIYYSQPISFQKLRSYVCDSKLYALILRASMKQETITLSFSC